MRAARGSRSAKMLGPDGFDVVEPDGSLRQPVTSAHAAAATKAGGIRKASDLAAGTVSGREMFARAAGYTAKGEGRTRGVAEWRGHVTACQLVTRGHYALSGNSAPAT